MAQTSHLKRFTDEDLSDSLQRWLEVRDMWIPDDSLNDFAYQEMSITVEAHRSEIIRRALETSTLHASKSQTRRL